MSSTDGVSPEQKAAEQAFLRVECAMGGDEYTFLLLLVELIRAEIALSKVTP